MRRIVGYFALGYLFVLVQTALWPALTPFAVKPDLILMLVVYLGLSEPPLRGGVLALLLGACLDAMAGSHPGLHGVILTLVFFCVRLASMRLNTENALLLLFMIGCGTLLHAALLLLFGSFADAGPLWRQLPVTLSQQLLFNLLFALLLLKIAPRIQRRLVPQGELPPFNRLDRRYGA